MLQPSVRHIAAYRTVCLFAGLLLSACGGDKAVKEPDAQHRPAEKSSPAGRAGGQDTDFCVAARDYNEQYVQAFLNDFGALAQNPTDAALQAQFRQHLKEAQQAGHAIEPKAPSAIGADFKTSLEAGDKMLAEMEKVNFDLTKVDPSVFSELSGPKFQEAGNRLSKYFTDVCRIPRPAVPSTTPPGA